MVYGWTLRGGNSSQLSLHPKHDLSPVLRRETEREESFLSFSNQDSVSSLWTDRGFFLLIEIS